MSRFIQRSAFVFGMMMVSLWVGQSQVLAAQEPVADAPGNLSGLISYEQMGDQVFNKEKEGAAETGAQSGYLPDLWCNDISHDETRASCWAAYGAGLNYYQQGLPHRLKVLRWNHLTTRIIFFTVLLLVLVGVYFSWVQFRRTLTHPQAGAAERHSVEVSTSGVKVSSPVLGVIILTLSLAFFYLYLVHVYPVHEIF